ncbi:hypothetical protein FOL47_001450 [Perkinsus chesapeaki]|uniref:Uncharacterized protein n=1 Tax=Perkinsus chesapeaki TaxID=330153 RepID=A0A7J6KUD8_PERCH|nr:hypothetical protein FOL47_001450 [Perkinsus chesapeaki]
MASYLLQKEFGVPDSLFGYHANERSKVSERWFAVVMSFVFTVMAAYIVMSAGLLLCMPKIIEHYTSQWTLELRDLRLGPDPASFEAPSENSSCLTSGSDKYVDISFVLTIADKPSWLEMNVIEIKVQYPDWFWNVIRPKTAYSGNRTQILVNERVLADHVRGPEYRQLWQMVESEQLTELQLSLTAEFSIFGQRSPSLLNWEPTFATLTSSHFAPGDSGGWCEGILALYWAEISDWNVPSNMIGSCDLL